MRHIVEAGILMPVGWLSCRDRRRGVCSSDLSNALVFLGRVSANANRANDLAIDFDWNAALQRSGPGQRQRRDPAVAHLIFENFARPTKDCRCARFSDTNLHARNLGIVEAFQKQQMTAVVHDDDYDSGATLLGFSFSDGSDFFRRIERQHFLRRQIPFDGSEEHKQKRKDS